MKRLIARQEDLLTFHARIYGRTFQAQDPVVGSSSTSSNLLGDRTGNTEDDLGYYTDGVKRTLTDDQIAIFRHSEVQSLLREQRHSKEGKKSDFKDVPLNKELENGISGVHKVEDDQDMGAECNAEDEDDEEEYARFLEAERKEMKLIASRQKRQGPNDQRPKSGKASTRRIVREMDAMTSKVNALEYSDEPDSQAKSSDAVGTRHCYMKPIGRSSSGRSNGSVSGRKIWWPVLQTRVR